MREPSEGGLASPSVAVAILEHDLDLVLAMLSVE
jgi:hypothetical protein